MSVNGVCVAGYPITGYETRRKEQNEVGGDFVKQAAEAVQASGRVSTTLYGADKETGDITVFSGAEVVTGSSISVYTTQDFDLEKPVYIVKIWDESGNVTERIVDVSKVEPKNCDTAEIYAYTANLKESGKDHFEDTVLKDAVAKALKNAEQRNSALWSFSEKADWIKINKS